MGAPALATARIVCPYSVSGVQHRTMAYVKGLTEVGGAWFVDDRYGGHATLSWEDCAEKLIDAHNEISATTTTWGTALLQEQIGLPWLTRSTHSYQGNPTVTALKYASQVTLTMRTQGFYLLKIIHLEGIEDPSNSKLVAPTGGDAPMDAFVDKFLTVAGSNWDPFKWMVSKDEAFMLASPFVSATFDLNRKIRRARGMA